MRVAILVAVTGCGRIDSSPVATADADTAPDSPAVAISCAGTVVCYRFDGDTRDTSGNSNDAIATSTGFTPSPEGQALVLSGGSSVTAPESSSLIIADILTVEAVVRVDALPVVGMRGVIEDHDSSYILWVTPTGAVASGLHLNGNGYSQSTAPNQLQVGTWHRLAATYDGAVHTIYVDHVAVASQAASGPIAPDSAAGLRIGSNLPDAVNPNQDPFVGAIDSLRVWHRVLAAAEL
jgi:hypothetical protein